jgi:hypothetical protein
MLILPPRFFDPRLFEFSISFMPWSSVSMLARQCLLTSPSPNFQEIHKGLVDSWVVYDNSGEKPALLSEGGMKENGQKGGA